MFSEIFQRRWQLCQPASSHYFSSLSLFPSLPFSGLSLTPSRSLSLLSLSRGALVSRVKQVKVLSHINIIFHINATWFVINLKLMHSTAIEYIYTRPLYIKPLSDRSNQNYTQHERLWLAQKRAWSWVWRWTRNWVYYEMWGWWLWRWCLSKVWRLIQEPIITTT